MNDALVLVVDEQDRPIGSANKQEIWEKGLLHRVVRIMIENTKGEILLQKRSKTKVPFPDCWDNSVAGHVDEGEDYDTAARREIKEEIGMTGLDFKVIGTYRANEIHDGKQMNRFAKVYKSTLNELPKKMEAGEIAGFEWWTLDKVKDLVAVHPDRVTDGLRQVIQHYY